MILLPTWVVLVGGAVLILVILAAVLVLARKPKAAPKAAPKDEPTPAPRRSWWKRVVGG